MPNPVVNRRLIRSSSDRGESNNYHPDTEAWKQRVITAVQSEIGVNISSDPEFVAYLPLLDTYVRDCYTQGLRNSSGSGHTITFCAPMFVSDTVSNANIKPVMASINLWYPNLATERLIFVNFTNADFSKTGVKGDGLTKYIRTGFSPSLAALDSFHGSVRLREFESTNTKWIFNRGDRAFLRRVNANISFGWNPSSFTQGTFSDSTTGGSTAALFTVTVEATNSTRCYTGNTLRATETTIVSGTLSAIEILLMAQTTTSAASNSSMRAQFVTFGGKIASNITAHNNAIATLMTATGRV